MKRGALAGVVLTGLGLFASVAEARVSQDERYGFDVTWNAAIRLLHVDMGFVITERDRETGYVLFTYRDANRSSPGSMELVRAQVDGVAGTRIIVQLSQEPTYAERLILTRLGRKLRSDYGEPPAPPRPAAPARPGGESPPADGETRPPSPGSERPSRPAEGTPGSAPGTERPRE